MHAPQACSPCFGLLLLKEFLTNSCPSHWLDSDLNLEARHHVFPLPSFNSGLLAARLSFCAFPFVQLLGLARLLAAAHFWHLCCIDLLASSPLLSVAHPLSLASLLLLQTQFSEALVVFLL